MEAMHRRFLHASFGLMLGLAGLTPTSAKAAANIVLWDTGSALADSSKPGDTTNWRPVPAEIFSLEKDPAKAASDPGYYGREYLFHGDAVVANHRLTAVFSSKQGGVTLFAKPLGEAINGGVTKDTDPGQKIAELVPLQLKSRAPVISDLRVVRNTDDAVALEVVFTSGASGSASTSALFAFDRTGIMEIRPAADCKGFSVNGAMDYAIAPSFIGDDLIFSGNADPSASSLAVPAENTLLGLAEGEGAELFMTWPSGKQRVNLQLSDASQGDRRIESIDFNNGGQSFYVSALRAPGIWHREKLTAAYLEKDVTSEWKRPFPARWKTQLLEEKVRTSYKFRDVKGEIWRGVPGSYTYPVWFDGDQAKFHLSKKVAPKGEAIIYFLEGHDTPSFVFTPADIIKDTLGRPAAESILDIAGRELRTHHRRADADVHRSCTCGYTEAIQTFFEKKQETARKDDIAGSLKDMVYFVQSHVNRINEYRKFVDDMTTFLNSRADERPELKPYLTKIGEIIQQIPQEYEVQKENMKSMSYAAQLVQETMALTTKEDPGNLAAYMELLKRWRGMGGSQDYLVARCHMITRQFAQAAGYDCVGQPAAVVTAMEIRDRCRQILRHPDGYEIWTDY